jgi:fucokinase / fucose-1-phosphate guanylyltransferase
MAAGDDAEVSPAAFGHVSQVVADLELKQGNGRAEAAVGVVVPILVPAHASPERTVLDHGVGGVMVGALVQQAGGVGPDGRPIEELQEQRVLIQDVEDPDIVTLDLGHPGGRDAAFMKRPPPDDNPVQRFSQPRDVFLGQEAVQDQVARVVEEEPFGAGGPGLITHQGRLLIGTPKPFAALAPASFVVLRFGQGLRRNRENAKGSESAKGSEGAKGEEDRMIWDLVVVTARTAQQRWLFERYLGQLWPAPGTSGAPYHWVMQDPPGPQLGTAGATLHALGGAAQRLGERFSRSRVLILHCGGLSQRVPQLSHLGKAFAPAAARDGDSTLFAQIVGELDRLFRGMEPGAVIACGDVMYTASGLDRPCRRNEAVAVACRASAEQGSRHGVYLWTPGCDHVSEAWQKPSAARLQALDAAQPWGLDTGILFLGALVVEQLLKAVGSVSFATAAAAILGQKRAWRGVELYRDLTPPMTPAWSPEERLPGAPGEAQRALSRFPLRLECPEAAELLHFGTNEELIRILGASGAPRVYSSYIAAGDLGPGVVLDRCLAERPLTVGAGSYVSGLHCSGRELTIAANRVAYQVPLRAAAAALARRPQVFVSIGMEDDPKRDPERGATLLGEPLNDWLQELGIAADLVWGGVPGAERSLWNARLFPVGEGEAVMDAVPWLCAATDGRFGERVDRWRAHARASMAEANRLFDARRWWKHEEQIRAHCIAAQIEAAVRRADSQRISELLSVPGMSEFARRLACRRLRALGVSAGASLTGARAWLVASALSSPAAAPLRERGFVALSRAMVREREVWGAELAWQIAPGQRVEAQAPVRVDLAGGWTDTPPQACERGGAVLNLALRLEGCRPLTARVERLTEPVVELIAEDLGCRLRLHTNPPARRRPDPRDPFGIHLGALRLIGLFTASPLPARLRHLGGGIRLTTAAQVPKGSGLGTSSILGAVALAALNRALGRQPSRDELCLSVLRLEQWMGTGGGWQDQVGGMWGGVKFAWSDAAIDQLPQVEPLALSPAILSGLAERMAVFYTGEPRLAKDVLQRVVAGYLVGQPQTMAVLDEMPGLARQARAAILAGDWERLGRCLDRSWELNQRLEPSCSNPSLAALFARIAPFVWGAKLAGAGGGGFLFALARDRNCREQLESLLAGIPAPAKLYSAELDREGLTVMG